jgi:threonine dehydrogenase-like Zn-dependent dehydrogenase
MPRVVQFTAPYQVDVVDEPTVPLSPGTARVATSVSGISAGTELTAYRGTNPYLVSTWDPGSRLFHHDADADHAEGGPAYPLRGWGYSEVGTVAELAEPGAGGLQVGDRVWGIWGHRSEAVLPVERLRGHRLPAGLDPVVGSFVRVGAIALNAVLAADAGPGDVCVVMGQGVIGLLATAFARQSGARVVAVEGIAARAALALELGAHEVHPPAPGLADVLRESTSGRGADVAIELSGSYAALQEATRLVGADGRVVASGFYQGPATPLRLGEEFHHNRVEVVASQIGSVPVRKRGRWDVDRLQETVVARLAEGRPDVGSLVSHRYLVEDAAEAYRMLDADPSVATQVVLVFEPQAS